MIDTTPLPRKRNAVVVSCRFVYSVLVLMAILVALYTWPTASEEYVHHRLRAIPAQARNHSGINEYSGCEFPFVCEGCFPDESVDYYFSYGPERIDRYGSDKGNYGRKVEFQHWMETCAETRKSLLSISWRWCDASGKATKTKRTKILFEVATANHICACCMWRLTDGGSAGAKGQHADQLAQGQGEPAIEVVKRV